MTDSNIGDDTTEVSTETTTQEEAKTFTQEEVNAIVARSKAKVTKQFEGVDVDEYKTLKQKAEEAEHAKKLEQGRFEEILQEKASKWNAEKTQLESKIHEYTVNTPIINAAAKLGAVDPDQVRELVKKNIRLNENGEVEVLDANGKPRYNDEGRPLSVDDGVREFLDSNPHFVKPTPSTTNTQTNHSADVPGELDITKLDMNNREDRAKYAEYRKKHGLG